MATIVRNVGLGTAESTLAVFVAVLAVLSLWLWARRIPTFKPNEVGILVALSAQGRLDPVEVRRVLDSLADRLSEESAQVNRSKRVVTVRRLRGGCVVADGTRARRLLEQSGASLVIHAVGTSGAVNGDPAVQFDRLSLTTRHRRMRGEALKEFQTSVGLVLAPLQVQRIRLTNDIIDINAVSQRIGTAAKYVLAMALASQGAANPAVSLLEDVISDSQPLLPWQRRAREVAAALYIAPWSTERWLVPGDAIADVTEALLAAQRALRICPDFSRGARAAGQCGVLSGQSARCTRQPAQASGHKFPQPRVRSAGSPGCSGVGARKPPVRLRPCTLSPRRQSGADP